MPKGKGYKSCGHAVKAKAPSLKSIKGRGRSSESKIRKGSAAYRKGPDKY